MTSITIFNIYIYIYIYLHELHNFYNNIVILIILTKILRSKDITLPMHAT